MTKIKLGKGTVGLQVDEGYIMVRYLGHWQYEATIMPNDSLDVYQIAKGNVYEINEKARKYGVEFDIYR